MASPDAILSVRQARFGYHRQAVVINGIDAALRPGRVTALVGPNAAGKTTLMRLMLGLLRPWSGVCEVEGKDVQALSARQRARLLSYVPQQPGVRFAFTVREVVAMGAHALGTGTAEVIDRVIDDAGLAGLAARVFSELSGGQQQRVLLARAALQASRGGLAMLLDEPGSHLDLHHRHATMQRLRRFADAGLAVLVVLHDLDLAARYADDAWLMDRGALVAAGRWDEVLTPALLSPVYRLPLCRVDQGSGRPALLVGPETGDTMMGEASGGASGPSI